MFIGQQHICWSFSSHRYEPIQCALSTSLHAYTLKQHMMRQIYVHDQGKMCYHMPYNIDISALPLVSVRTFLSVFAKVVIYPVNLFLNLAMYFTRLYSPYSSHSDLCCFGLFTSSFKIVLSQSSVLSLLHPRPLIDNLHVLHTHKHTHEIYLCDWEFSLYILVWKGKAAPKCFDYKIRMSMLLMTAWKPQIDPFANDFYSWQTKYCSVLHLVTTAPVHNCAFKASYIDFISPTCFSQSILFVC